MWFVGSTIQAKRSKAKNYVRLDSHGLYNEFSAFYIFEYHFEWSGWSVDCWTQTVRTDVDVETEGKITQLKSKIN